MNIYGILVSLIIHLTLLLLLLWHNADFVEQIKKTEQKKHNAGVINAQIYDEDINNNTISCANYYDGIGLKLDLITGEVIGAPTTLPAYKSGIRAGDFMDLEELYSVDRPLGAIMTLHILRNGAKLLVHPVVSKICDDV